MANPLWWSSKTQPADGNIGVINYDNYRLKVLVYPWWETASSTMFRSIHHGNQPENNDKVYFTDLQNVVLPIEIAGIKLPDNMSDKTEIGIRIYPIGKWPYKTGFQGVSKKEITLTQWINHLERAMGGTGTVYIDILDESMKIREQFPLSAFRKEHPKLLKYVLQTLFNNEMRRRHPPAAAAA